MNRFMMVQIPTHVKSAMSSTCDEEDGDCNSVSASNGSPAEQASGALMHVCNIMHSMWEPCKQALCDSLSACYQAGSRRLLLRMYICIFADM